MKFSPLNVDFSCPSRDLLRAGVKKGYP